MSKTLEQLNDMLSNGSITEAQYNVQRADILSEQTASDDTVEVSSEAMKAIDEENAAMKAEIERLQNLDQDNDTPQVAALKAQVHALKSAARNADHTIGGFSQSISPNALDIKIEGEYNGAQIAWVPVVLYDSVAPLIGSNGEPLYWKNEASGVKQARLTLGKTNVKESLATIRVKRANGNTEEISICAFAQVRPATKSPVDVHKDIEQRDSRSANYGTMSSAPTGQSKAPDDEQETPPFTPSEAS